jgi:hypothetical protein
MAEIFQLLLGKRFCLYASAHQVDGSVTQEVIASIGEKFSRVAHLVLGQQTDGEIKRLYYK